MHVVKQKSLGLISLELKPEQFVFNPSQIITWTVDSLFNTKS